MENIDIIEQRRDNHKKRMDEVIKQLVSLSERAAEINDSNFTEEEMVIEFEKIQKEYLELNNNYIVEDTTIEIKKDYHIAIDKLVFDYLEIDDNTREKLLKELVGKVNSRYKKMLK